MRNWKHWTSNNSICPLSMGGAEEIHGWTVKTSMASVLAIAAVLSMLPGGLLSDMRGTQGLEIQQLAQGSTQLHRRLKRGWIWKQLFVPEEDPTPRVIGQVPAQIECLPRPSYTTSLCLLEISEEKCLSFQPSSLLPLVFAAQIWFWSGRVFHQVRIIRRRRWRCVWDKRI